MTDIFKTDFNSYVCEGDTITAEVGELTVVATIYRDDHADRPDERDCGFWPSLDPQSAGYIGPKSQRTLDRAMVRAKAVMAAWEQDRWFYCGVAVTVMRDGEVITGEFSNALWGVDCNYPTFNKRRRPNTYLREVANELAAEALNEAAAPLRAIYGDGFEGEVI